MLSKFVVLIVVVILCVCGFIVYTQYIKPNPTTPEPVVAVVATPEPILFDFGNKTVTLNNEPINFTNGAFQKADQTNGTHTALISNINLNPAKSRAAATIIDNPGGSGTFYYLIGASLKDGQEIYSTPILLGDRVKIVSLKVDDPGAQDSGMITIEYLDRPANVPMSTEPTKPVTKKYSFQEDGNLIEVLH